ncbi:MAG: GNAT family N-acetyltransferase [Oscillospiraceae bacterium]|nr:GNAT family N-acetyltransferase [Oscillospiraceae bacterium]
MNYKTENLRRGDADYILDRLVEYNLSQVPARQDILYERLDKKISGEDGRIIAGCIARTYCWNVACVDILWVDGEYRGKGLGSALLAEIENSASKKGCYLIHVDTFDFQAKGFYEKQGYRVFGVLEDCPKGHSRYYMKKDLQQRCDSYSVNNKNSGEK